MKSEFGLNHYEGRGWRGFHHHASLCIATYAFTVLERLRHPVRKKKSASTSAACRTRRPHPAGLARRVASGTCLIRWPRSAKSWRG